MVHVRIRVAWFSGRHAEGMQTTKLKQSRTVLDVGTRRTLLTQGLIVLMTTAGFAIMQNFSAALAALFGGSSAVVLAAFLAMKVHQLERQFRENKSRAAAIVMLGFMPRLVLVLGLFWVGLGWLKLLPVPMIVGFTLTYFGYLLNFYKLKQ